MNSSRGRNQLRGKFLGGNFESTASEIPNRPGSLYSSVKAHHITLRHMMGYKLANVKVIGPIFEKLYRCGSHMGTHEWVFRDLCAWPNLCVPIAIT